MRRCSMILAMAAALFVWAGTVSAHYGAKYEPPDGMLYHGVGWNYQNSMQIYSDMFPPDHHPLILQVNTSIPGTRGTDVARSIGALTNNILHPDSQFIEYSVHFQGRDAWMLDSVFALTDEMDGYMDTLAIAMREVGRPIFLRIGFEFNGNWNPYHPYIYPLAFRKLAEGLRERGFDDFATVWCYEADAGPDFADRDREGNWKWYPGDDIVDWFGLDPFDADGFNQALPDTGRNGQLSKKGKTEAFLRFARERGKPVYLNEFSAVRIDVTTDEEDPDSADGQADWEAFFVPFFEFLGNHPEIKGLNYIDLDWSVVGHYGEELDWRDARLEVNSYIRNRWVAELMDERFINAGYDITRHEASVPGNGIWQPVGFNLQAHPNPFNGMAHLTFTAPQTGEYRLQVYALNGALLQAQVFEVGSPGSISAGVNMTDYPAGLYLARVSGMGQAAGTKLLLLR